MAQQMLDLDLLRALRIRKIREELRQGIVVAELPLLDELTDGEAREELVHAAQEKGRIDGVGDLLLAVRIAIGLREHRLAIPRDDDGPGENIRIAHTLQIGADFLKPLLLGTGGEVRRAGAGRTRVAARDGCRIGRPVIRCGSCGSTAIASACSPPVALLRRIPTV